MAKMSAGIMVYRRAGLTIEVLLGHPGGPFWAKKDKGAWSVPKGEVEPGEDLLTAAKREFQEETGQVPPEGTYIDLGSFKRNNKEIFAWAVEGDLDTAAIKSNMVQLEWPPKSGDLIEFPEVDRAAWVAVNGAPEKLHTGQDIFIKRLVNHLGAFVPKPPKQQALL